MLAVSLYGQQVDKKSTNTLSFVLYQKLVILPFKSRAACHGAMPGSSPGGSREFEGWTALALKDLFID